MDNVNNQKNNALMTFAFGEGAINLEHLSDKDIKDEIYTNLKSIYKDKTLYPKELLRTAWHNDTNTLGSYSFTSVETRMKDFDILAKTINSKLYFAGEHTSQDYFSTVHGAYLSGIREAKKNK